MEPSDVNLVAIIVLGVIGFTATVGSVYAKVKGDQAAMDLLIPYTALAETLVQRMDTALVPYGQQLKPVNDVAVALQTLLHNPDSFVVQILPKPIEEAASAAVDMIQDLTDGSLEEGQEQTAK